MKMRIMTALMAAVLCISAGSAGTIALASEAEGQSFSTEDDVIQPEADVKLTEADEDCFGEAAYDAEGNPAENVTDNLLSEYLDQELQTLLSETGGTMGDADGIRNTRNGDRLSGLNREAYDVLREHVEKVAAGEETYTVLNLQLDVSAYDGLEWTAEDLGISSLVTETEEGMTISEEAHAAMTSLTGYDRELIILALLRDCPAEMYWFGLAYYCGVPYAVYSDGGEYRIRMTGEVQVILSVSADYSAYDENGERILYTTDAGKVSHVNDALANAAAVIEEANAFASDREKLEFYYNKLGELSGYDYAAAAGAPYGDPWQIISIFDNDPETMVVCEGYSKGYQYLCDHTSFASDEIRCLCAVGIQTWEGAGQPQSTHMWNVVRMDDGANYLVDVTNGNGFSWLFLASCVKGNMSEGYYIHAETLNGKVINYLYIYDDDTKHLFPEEDLKLAGNETEPIVTPTVTPYPTMGPEPTVTPTVTPTPIVTPTPTVTPVPTAQPVKLASAAFKYKENKTLVYNGKARKPIVVVKAKVNGKTKTLTKNTDYTVKYTNNKKVGTATITITGRGGYTGTKKLTFKIIPKGTSLTSVKAGKNRFTAKWKKQAVQTAGYQLRYSTSKDMSGSKTYQIKGTKNLSKTKTGLAKGKTYYVQVRTYQTVSGRNYYSSWSKRSIVKI